MSVPKLTSKPRFTPNLITQDHLSSEESAAFEQLLQQGASAFKEKALVKGVVVSLESNTVVVDVGLKNEGRIPISEFKLELNCPLPQVGETVELYVDKYGPSGELMLSKAKAVRQKALHEVQESFETGKLVTGIIFERVRSGFAVDLSGVVAFLPGGQVDLRPVDNDTIQGLMNTPQQFRVMKMDGQVGNIVVSRRAVLEEQRAGAKKEFLSKIVEGETILEGVIKNITEYGAFVDHGYMDSLLHKAHISHTQVNHPLEVLHIGQKVKVLVIKFDKETERLHVGMKQLTEAPWRQKVSELPRDQVLKGRVTKIDQYKAFVSLGEDIEGVLMDSEISWAKNPPRPHKILRINQEIDCMIKDVDLDRNQIQLTMKRCKPNPWIEFANNHKVGDIITATVRNAVAGTGVFVALGDEIDGLIYPKELSWEGSESEEIKKYIPGQEVQAKVWFVDPEKEQILLSIRQISANPNEKILSQDKLTCTVIAVEDDYIQVSLPGGLTGIIEKSELALDRAEQKTSNFQMGQEVQAKPLHGNNLDTVMLSIKALEFDEQEKIIEIYSSSNQKDEVIDLSKLSQNNKDQSDGGDR